MEQNWGRLPPGRKIQKGREPRYCPEVKVSQENYARAHYGHTYIQNRYNGSNLGPQQHTTNSD
jgi:hypothetical protein